MTKITIVAAILDTSELTLYKPDGSTIVLKQGDTRIKGILEQSQPLVRQSQVEIDFQDGAPVEPERNDYKEFEEKTSGVVKFFRVAKSAVRSFFGGEITKTDNGLYGTDEHLAPVNLGVVPTTDMEPGQVRDATLNQKPSMEEATKQIMAQAKPVSDPDYNHADTSTEETMIAQVTDDQGKTAIVPGMENLQAQFRHASKLGNTEGVTNFLKRIAAVIEDRGHTIDELLNFMSKGDLPIADDGSIVAYKVLKTIGGLAPGYFVDCHSSNVKQRVGSYVTQANVDPNRRTECSTGLHIARRGYLGNFHGNIIVLVKVAPEDVIAVPFNEPNKMRARGYHILSLIPAGEHYKLRANGPVEGSEAKKLLTQALRGNHIPIIEDVVIGGTRGNNLTITPRPGFEADKPVETPKVARNTPKSEPVAPIVPEPVKPTQTAPKVDPKQVAAKATKAKAETRDEKITRLIGVMRSNGKLNERTEAAQELKNIKTSAKKSWNILGINAANVSIIQQLTKAEPVKKATPGLKQAVVAHKKSTPKKTSVPAKPKGEAEVTEEQLLAQAKRMIEDTLASTSLSRNQKAASLVNIMTGEAFTLPVKKEAYRALIAFKRQAKVGWGQLGVDNFDALQTKFEGK